MKKVFYFLDIWITNEDYEFFMDKLFLIQNWFTSIEIIDKFYYKIWENNEWRINKSFFLEAITFIDYCKNELDIELSEIKWIYKENFLIFNYDFYIFDDQRFEKIDIKNTYFFNIRYPWLNHIFKIFNDLWWKSFWINHRWDWPYNDKLYFISKLYKSDIKKYVWDIIVPYINNWTQKTYKLLYDFIVKKFSSKQIVLKKSFWEMWNWVRAVDLNKIKYKDFVNIIENKFVNLNSSTDSFYIVPFYNIIKENRIYYLYDSKKDNFEIYCVKQKNTNFEGVFELESLELYKWIQVSWSYCDKNEVLKDKKLFGYLKRLVKLLWFETWVLEIGILWDWEYRFFEINPYWWSLMFKQDQEDMYNFYYNMYKLKFN